MATSQEIEADLQRKQADYLRRVQESGLLPQQISDKWNQLGGADVANLRKQEGDLLTKYISAAPESRDYYKDVWNPLTREKLAAQRTAQSYSPIAQIRQELAMRADALNAATRGIQSTYNADTQALQTDIGFTQDALNRALQREQAAAAAAAKAASSRGGGRKSSGKAPSPKTQAQEDINAYIQSGAWQKEFDSEKNFLPSLYQAYPELNAAQLNKMFYDSRKPFETKWGKLQSFQG